MKRRIEELIDCRAGSPYFHGAPNSSSSFSTKKHASISEC